LTHADDREHAVCVLPVIKLTRPRRYEQLLLPPGQEGLVNRPYRGYLL